MSIKCTLINNETGEILNENFNIEELKDTKRRKEMAEKDRLSKEFKQIQQEFLGNFVFFIFKNIDHLEKILNDNDLVKFIYIGTYTKSNGALMLDNNITYINKIKLKQSLHIGDKAFREFYNKIITNKLLLEEDDKLYINLEYFWRGKEKDYKKLMEQRLEDFTRLYIETTRELYLNTGSKSHRKLAMIYKLLPYISWKYNIICYNINEKDKNQISALTLANVMDILGYDKSNITRFRKDFYSLKYNDYPIFKSVEGAEGYRNSIIIVNPLTFYRGNDIRELEGLIALFNVKVNKTNNEVN